MSEQDIQRGLSRRSFLRELAGVGMGGAALAACAGSTGAPATAASGTAATIRPTANNIGLQLYTVRDLLEKDFEGTIERIAQIGYRELEFAGYYNRTPEQVRALLQRLGLTSPSAHIGVDLLRQDLAGQIRSARTIGQRYLTVPFYRPEGNANNVAAWQQLASELNRWGAASRDQGIRVAYHSHAWEFEPLAGGRSAMDVLFTETDPALVDFELDLYWARYAGRDPVQIFPQHPGRFPMWHVKDMRDPQGTKAMTPVGQGTIDFKSIFAQARQSGMRHFFVEHDDAAATVGSLNSIQTSYQHLRQMLG